VGLMVAEGGGDDCFLGVKAIVRKMMESKGRRRRKKVARSYYLFYLFSTWHFGFFWSL
jgi:hypothetical protein